MIGLLRPQSGESRVVVLPDIGRQSFAGFFHALNYQRTIVIVQTVISVVKNLDAIFFVCTIMA